MARFSIGIEIPEQVLLLFLCYFCYVEIQCILRRMRDADDAVTFVLNHKFAVPKADVTTNPQTDKDHDKDSESSFAFDAPLPAQQTPQGTESKLQESPAAS